jgi:hypothetical protein
MVTRFSDIAEAPAEEQPTKFADLAGQALSRRDFLTEFLYSDKPVEQWLPADQAGAAQQILDSFDDPENERARSTAGVLISSMFDIPFEDAIIMQPEVMKQLYGEELTAKAGLVKMKDGFAEFDPFIGFKAAAASAAQKPALALKGLTAFTPGQGFGFDKLLDITSDYLVSLGDEKKRQQVEASLQGVLWPSKGETPWYDIEPKKIPEAINTWAANVGDYIPLMIMTRTGQAIGKAIGKPTGAAVAAGVGVITGGPDPTDVATVPAVAAITERVLEHVGGASPLIAIETGGFLTRAEQLGIDKDIAEQYARIFGPSSGAIEYAQTLWNLAAFKRVSKPQRTTILKAIIKELGGAAVEGFEEVTQGGLENFLIGKAIDAQKIRNPGFAAAKPPILEDADRQFAIGAGLALVTRAGGAAAMRAISTKQNIGIPPIEATDEGIVEPQPAVTPTTEAVPAAPVAEPAAEPTITPTEEPAAPEPTEGVVEGQTETTEQGSDFSSGQSVTFEFIRNTEKSPDFGPRFQQDIEPAGRFMQIKPSTFKEGVPNLISGKITFENPLVLEFNTGDQKTAYDENNWKARLSKAFGNKTGKELSRAVLDAGFDGIVTVGQHGETSEIVDLKAIKAQPTPTAEPAPKKPPGLTRAEQLVAKEKAAELRAKQAEGEKVGFKAGERASREKAKVAIQKLKAAQKLTEGRRKTAVDLVKTFIEKESRGDFLTRIAEAKTPKDLEKINTAIEKGVERAEKKESVGNLRKAIKSVSPKKMLPEFGKPAKAIIDSLQIGKSRDETVVKNSDLKEMAQQVLDTARPDSVAAFKAQQLLDELRTKTAKTFAVNQLSVDAIDQITDTLIALRFQNDADTIAAKDENAEEAIRRRSLIKEQITEPPVNPEKFGGKAVKKFKLIHDNLESLTDAVGGSRAGTYDLWAENKGAMTEFVYDVIDKGVDTQATHNKEAGNILREVLADNDVSTNQVLSWMARKTSKINKLLGRNIKPDLKSFTLQDARGASKDFEFTANERMSIFMHTRNSHNLSVLLKDGWDSFVEGKKVKIRGFTVEIIDEIIDSLSSQQKNVARQIGSKLMDGFNRDSINEVSRKLEFRDIATVENYWPARRSITTTLKGKRPFVQLIESMGILKERVGIGNPLRGIGFFETVHASNKNVSTYVGLAEPMREVKAVLTTDVVAEMEDSGRDDEARRINKLIENIEGKLVPAFETELEEIFSKMLGGFAKAKLFLNLKIAPRQQISELLVSAYVDPKYMRAFRGKTSKALIAEITELSPQMAARIEGFQFDRDIGDAFEQNELIQYLTGDLNLIDRTGLGMRFFDTNAIVDIYRANKAEVMDKNPDMDINSDEGKALLKERFEWTVRHTQPVWHIKDRSALGGSRNPLVRVFTMFMSQREQLVRMVNNGISQFANSEKTIADQGRLGRTLGTVAFNLFMFSLYNFAWAALAKRKKRDVLDFTRDFFKDILALPFFGKYFAEAFSSSFNVVVDKPVFQQGFQDDPVEGILASLLLDGLVGFTRAGVHFVDGERYQSGPNRGELKWKNELWVAMDSVIDAVASLKGLPYYGAKDIIETAKAQIPKEKTKSRRRKLKRR